MSHSFKESQHTKAITNSIILTVLLLLSLSLVLVLCLVNTTNGYGLVSNSSSKIVNSNGNNVVISNSKIIDPNPDLIEANGKLKNDVSLVANTNTYRLGTIADGVSKLVLVMDSNKTLQFSIDGTDQII